MQLRLGWLVSLVCMVALGCSGESRIRGKWENKEFQETYEFRADGTYEYMGSGDVRRLLGPYRVDGDRVYLTAKMFTGSGHELRDEITTYEFSVDGDLLTLTKPPRPGVTYSHPSVRYRRLAE